MEVTETGHETRGFPPIAPIEAPPETARFMTAMRRPQDIVVSTDPNGDVLSEANGLMINLLPHQP
jgi:hypothetical protein